MDCGWPNADIGALNDEGLAEGKLKAPADFAPNAGVLAAAKEKALLEAPNAGVPAPPNAGVLDDPNAGVPDAPKAGAPNAGVLVAPKPGVLAVPNAGALAAPNAGVLVAPNAPNPEDVCVPKAKDIVRKRSALT